MLQQGGFPSDLTVTETARMWAGTLSRPRAVGEALEMVDLAQRATVGVKSLSGGERRRLDLALALMNRPDVLFLDEPTTGLDPESRRNTWRLIGDIVAAGAAVVLTSHDLEEAEELADRLAIMHDGRIVTTGTPTDIAGLSLDDLLRPARRHVPPRPPGDRRMPGRPTGTEGRPGPRPASGVAVRTAVLGHFPRRDPGRAAGAQLSVLGGRQARRHNRHEAVQIARRHGWI